MLTQALALLFVLPGAEAFVRSPPSMHRIAARSTHHGAIEYPVRSRLEEWRPPLARHRPLVRCAAESSEPARSRQRKAFLTLAGGAAGALAALASGSRRGGLLIGCGCITLAKVGLLLFPLFAAVRLYRNGEKRAAYRLALVMVARRFCTRWWQYLTIPLAAGAVGWVTNKLAVDMIFYPIEFGGLRLRTYPNQPLGWIGWQGIVPAKAAIMAQRITDLVTTKLLNVKQVFNRLDPD